MALPTFRELIADYKAHRRGDKRVSPYGTRGRVYAPKVPPVAPEAPAGTVSKSKPKLTIRAVITRADGTVEDRGVIHRG